jgi:phenylalanyl-tRNA synthetase beta chain
MVVPLSVSAQELLSEIRIVGGEILEDIKLVDQYQGEGISSDKKSLTFSMLFRAKDRTLTQSEANETKERAVAACKEKFAAELRS